MPEFVSVLQDPESKTVVTVSKGHAESAGLDVLEQPAVDGRGRPLGPRTVVAAPSDLKGAALDEALDHAGLPKSGNAGDKRQRLADHQAAGNTDQEVTQ